MIQYLNVHGIKVKVDCYIKGLIEELKRDYGVFFTKGEKDFDVEVIVEKLATNVLDREYFITLKGNYCLVRKSKIHFLIINDKDVKFYKGEFRKYFTAVISRNLYEKYNALCFHSATVDINGKGIVFMGESGSGKTSLALQFFLNDAKYVSNDLTFLHKEKNVHILGMPQQTNLGHGALAWFYKKSPDLFNENYDEAYKKYNANQLFEKGNLDKVSIDIADKEATVLWTDCKYIIFPQPNVGANEPVIELLKPETLAIKLLAHIIPPFKYGFQTICDEQKYYETIIELIDKIKRDVKGFNFFWTEDHDMNERFLRKFINV